MIGTVNSPATAVIRPVRAYSVDPAEVRPLCSGAEERADKLGAPPKDQWTHAAYTRTAGP
jgi:hypothetical protein